MPQKSNDRDPLAASPVPQDQDDELEMADDDEDVDDEDDVDDETEAGEDVDED